VNLLGPLDEASQADWDWIIGVNLTGIFNTLKTFLPKIKRHGEGGHVVNVASMGAFISDPNARECVRPRSLVYGAFLNVYATGRSVLRVSAPGVPD
jgi:NAD(P)-dependent dehydrogenase (short-subunit alcohol dehydrogenase family)